MPQDAATFYFYIYKLSLPIDRYFIWNVDFVKIVLREQTKINDS